MKKFLLKIWDFLNFLWVFIKNSYHSVYDFFFRQFHACPSVMTITQTVKYIIKTNCSVVRFGDGEIKLIAGIDLPFQKSDAKIASSLSESLKYDRDDILVCIPDMFTSESRTQYNAKAAAHWKKHLSYYRKYWCKNLNADKLYGNAFISRPYNNYLDRSHCKDYFNLVKKIWDNREIIVVEGEMSRLGMGNDLFDNAKSVERILCPSSDCFEKADDIIGEISKCDKSKLILLAIGPTASVLPIELTNLGYTAIDIGNIDTEYEWFNAGAIDKQPVKNKLVYEAGGAANVGEATDEKYLSQIISKVI